MRRIVLLVACVAFLFVFVPRGAHAQQGAPTDQVAVPPVAPQPEIVAPTTDEVQKLLDEAKAAPTPDADRIAQLEQVQAMLTAAAAARAKATDYERQAAEAPALIAGLKAELAQAPDQSPPVVPPDATLRQYETEQSQAEANRVAAQKSVDDLAVEAQARTDRTAEIPTLVAQRKQQISEQTDALRALPPDDLRALVLRAQITGNQAEVRALEAERALYDALRDRLPLRRDKAQRQLERARQLASAWQDLVTKKRQDDAAAAAAAAQLQREEITADFPELAAIAKRNQELATMRTGPEGIAAQIDDAKRAFMKSEGLEKDLAARFETTRRKVALGGLGEGTGLWLRREYDWIPEPSLLRARSGERRQRYSASQFQQIEIEEELADANDVTVRLQKLVDARTAADGTLPEGYESLARELLETQKTLLTTTRDDLKTLIDQLLEHERLHIRLLPLATAYRTYISERILWVRSTSGGALPDLADAARAAAWLVDIPDWLSVPRKLMPLVGERPFEVVGELLLLIVLVATGGRARRRITESCEHVRSFRTDSFRHTLTGLLAVLWLALPLPVALTAAARLLSDLPDELVARAVGSGLAEIAAILYVLDVLRIVLKKRGFGETHFRWPEGVVAGVRVDLRWFVPLMVPLRLLAATFDAEGSPEFGDSLGRLCFVASTTAVAVLLYRLLHPSRGHLMEKGQRELTSLLGRTLPVWFTLAVGGAAALVILALAGYYYTAYQLELRLRDSVGLAVLVLFMNSLLLRWLFVARRKLAVERARARAQARAEATSADGDESSVRESTTLDEDHVDIPAIDAQTRQLFRSGITVSAALGLYLIWAGTLPALRGLDRIQLYPSIAIRSSSDTSVEDIITSASTNGTPTPGVGAAAPAGPAGAAGQASGATGTAQTANGAAATSSGGAAPGGASATPAPGPLPGMPAGAAEADTPPPADVKPAVGVVTLADVFLTLLVVVLTFIAVRNIPGLLEMSVLARLPLDTGERYAVSTLIRYILVIIGTSVAFSSIGIGWSQVQWLAAALTFGLAFGLQEIFANFVSGIIILLERPVRVGDIVTIGGVEGRVTRLRMRALTILDWDRRELLVPNKDLITSNVINWTLSDPVTRIVIAVGVAYGSDTKRARELLLQAARDNPIVMDDPAPSAIFRRFGDSTLDFELRIYLANRDLWPQVIDSLHTQIDEAFRGHGIEIAFPQRDLHIRSAEGLTELAARMADAGARRRGGEAGGTADVGGTADEGRSGD
ncbi:MAG: mechanosensitive ion channel [Planctomycetes bacterium]|nr:mechanosensitive ion channel [Planctomycetota bacterium]